MGHSRFVGVMWRGISVVDDECVIEGLRSLSRFVYVNIARLDLVRITTHEEFEGKF